MSLRRDGDGTGTNGGGAMATNVDASDARGGVSTESDVQLFVLGQRALGMTSAHLARVLEVSPKTVYRWTGRRSSIGTYDLGRLAHLVYPIDPALAARIHARALAQTVGVGIPPPAPLPSPKPREAAPAPPPPPSLPVKPRVEAMIHAACSATDVTPSSALPVLAAAFRRARELGLTVEEVENELAPEKKEEARSRKKAK